MQIKELFDPSKDIYRTIEKVITYNASQEARLKAEISEYIVTDSIEAQFEELLTKMQHAMEVGGVIEVGVWVSGFYGSGKSSFTKYLGLALDQNVVVDGVRVPEAPAGPDAKAADQSVVGYGGRQVPGRRRPAGLGQRNARRSDHGGGFHRPVLQSAPLGRLLPQPEGGRLRAAAPERRPLRRVPGQDSAGVGNRLEGSPERPSGRRQLDSRARPRDVPGPV